MQTATLHIDEIATWQELPKSDWMDNKTTNHCTICAKYIRSGIFKTNKHHCRYWYCTCIYMLCPSYSVYVFAPEYQNVYVHIFSGSIVCDGCSRNRVYKLDADYNRICDKCHEEAIQYISRNIKRNINGDIFEPLTWKHHKKRNELLAYGFCRKYIIDKYDNDYFDVVMISVATWIGRNDRFCINKERDINDLEISYSGQYLERISIEDRYFYHGFGQEVIGLNNNKEKISRKIWWFKILKIDKNNKNPNIGIGIIDSRFVMRLTENDDFLKMRNCAFGINLNDKNRKTEWKVGDTITMELDLNGEIVNDDDDEQTNSLNGCGILKFVRNGCINLLDKKISVNPYINYRLIISMYSQDAIVLL